MFVYALQIDYLVFISCIELNNVYIDIYKLLIPERLILSPSQTLLPGCYLR